MTPPDPGPAGCGPDWPNWTPSLYRFRPPDLGNAATFWLRQVSGLDPRTRLRLHVEREEMLHRLEDLDHAMAQTAEERLRILEDLAHHRDLLYPRTPWPRGRRPPEHGHPALPPAAEGAVPVAGAVLRRICLEILARHGTLRLIEIHAWLHRYGFVIAHHHPVKALADALRQEHERRHAHRVSRGTYRLGERYRPPHHDRLGGPPGGDPPTVVDPLTDPPSPRGGARPEAVAARAGDR